MKLISPEPKKERIYLIKYLKNQSLIGAHFNQA